MRPQTHFGADKQAGSREYLCPAFFYALNFFQLPVIAYNGDQDPQAQAADIGFDFVRPRVGDEVTDDGANAALPSPPALFSKHDEAVHGAPALSNQHGTATEHAAPKGFRLPLNPAASSQIGISQSAAVAAVAAPNQ